MAIKEKITIDDLDFEKGGGLLPVVVQDFVTRKILMVAYVNKEALLKTLETGLAHYWSRSRGILWLKGETSGHYQKVVRIEIDCDEDALIYLVEPLGPACHTGNFSCFFRELDGIEKIKKKYDEKIITEIISYLKKQKSTNNNSKGTIIIESIQLDPKIIAWIADKINTMTSNNIDKVVVKETLTPIGSFVAQMKGKPLVTIRKHFIPSEKLLDKVKSGHKKETYYIYNINENDKVLIINDTISTDKSLTSIIETLLKHNIKIMDIVCITEKKTHNRKEIIENRFGIPIKTLIKIS